MFLLLAQLALANPQAIHELEVSRAPAGELQAHLEGDAPLRAIRALARIGDPAALPWLAERLDDPSAEVRIAAARALGWIGGSAPILREAWNRTPAPLPGPRAYPRDDLRRALLWSFGRQGEAEDVQRLIAELNAPTPYASEAAIALGRMGRREVDGIERAVEPLVAQLSLLDRERSQAAAFAIYRIGLDGAADSVVEAVGQAAREVPSASARAWLLRAAFAVRPSEALLSFGVADADQLVRASAAAAVQEGDFAALLHPLLDDPWPHVRLAAARALARLGDARGVAALPPLEAAARELESAPPSELLDRALHAEAPADRTLAAGLLLGRDDLPDDVGDRLLLARDEAIREAALELLGPGELNDERLLALLQHARVEDDPSVLVGVLDLAHQALSEERKGTAAQLDAASAALPRLLDHRSLRVRRAAVRIAVALDLPGVPTRSEFRHATLSELEGVHGAVVTTEHGSFRIALDDERAPLAVANFVALAEEGFFDTSNFHRVVPGFVVQGGCPRGDGWGGPGWTLADEVSAARYVEGAVGMARAAPDTGGSQWFVTLTEQPHLDGDYTLFGQVVQGLHVVRQIEPGDAMTVRIERAQP